MPGAEVVAVVGGGARPRNSRVSRRAREVVLVIAGRGLRLRLVPTPAGIVVGVVLRERPVRVGVVAGRIDDGGVDLVKEAGGRLAVVRIPGDVAAPAITGSDDGGGGGEEALLTSATSESPVVWPSCAVARTEKVCWPFASIRVSSAQDQGLAVSRHFWAPSTRNDTDDMVVLVVFVTAHWKVPESWSPAPMFCLTFQPDLCPEAGATNASRATRMSSNTPTKMSSKTRFRAIG